MNESLVKQGLKYEFGRFLLDPGERLLLVAGRRVHLTDKVFDTLLFLVQNNGRLLTKDEMMSSIWEESFVEESNLAKNVSRLRKILNSDGVQFIQTVPRRGYRFQAEVSEIDESADMLLHRRLRIKLTHTIENDDLPSSNPPELAFGEIHSIAVLPFQPLNLQDDADIFGLGLSDALITQMNRAGQLQVRPTSSILKYNLPKQDTRAAGHELQVDAVLEGRFQRASNKLRLTVQLTRAADGASLWADIFNTDVDDIFSVQDVIAESVMTSLNKKLTDEARARIRRRYTENVDAYEQYLQGRVSWNKRTIEGYQEARECFEKAIKIDPLYALAHAGLADIYNLLPLYDSFSPSDCFPKAKAAALKALSIDPDLSEAHAALGLSILHYDWNWSGAEASFRNAIRLNPNNPSAYQLLGVYLCRAGRISEAIVALKQAQELDPVSPINATWLGEVLRYYGEIEKSIELHLETLKSFPDFFIAHYHLAFSYIDARRFDEAEFHRAKAVSLSNENSLTLSLQGILQAAMGRDAEVHKTLHQLLRMREERYIGGVNIASVYAALGDRQRVMEWLRIALQERDPNLTWIKFDKEFTFLVNDPEFKSILMRVGLAGSSTEVKSLSPAASDTRSRWLAIGAIVSLCLAIGAAILYAFSEVGRGR